MVILGKGINVAVTVSVPPGPLMVEVNISVGKASKVPTKSGVVVAETIARLVGEADTVGEKAKTGVVVGLAVAVGLRVAVPVMVMVGLMVLVAVRVGVIVAVGDTVACCRAILTRGSRSTKGAIAA